MVGECQPKNFSLVYSTNLWHSRLFLIIIPFINNFKAIYLLLPNIYVCSIIIYKVLNLYTITWLKRLSLFFVLSSKSFTKKKMRWSFCLSPFFFGDWWLRYISVGLTSISGICFWRLAFTLTELSGFVSASRSSRWRQRLLTGIPGYRWLTFPFVTRSTVSLLTSLFDVGWIVDDWIFFEASIWCAARIYGKIALSEAFFIRLIDFRWFTGISWSLSEERRSNNKVAAVRILFRWLLAKTTPRFRRCSSSKRWKRGVLSNTCCLIGEDFNTC